MKVMMMALSLDLSGQSVHIRNLGKGLISRGHEVIVAAGELAIGEPLGKEYFEKSDMTVIHVPVANIGAWLSSFATQLLTAGWSLCHALKRY